MKKVSAGRFLDYIVEVDAVDGRILALAEILKNQEEAPEPWVLNEIGDILIEHVSRRKTAEIFFLGRDPKGLLGVSDTLVEGELKRLEIEHGEGDNDE